MSVIPTNKDIIRTILNDYKRQQKHFLLTSRFNTQTWNENQSYRSRINIKGCIYCSPEKISHKIPNDAIMFILEMNNDENTIMGIGMVRNRPFCEKYKVYNNGNYNRYNYAGNNRISREEMTEEEEIIMQVFDILCFTGNKHMKRGQGLRSFPLNMLYNCSKQLDLVKFISEMFKSRLIKNENS